MRRVRPLPLYQTFTCSNIQHVVPHLHAPSYYYLGGLNCPGGGGGVCEMKAIDGVKKMVNYYPLIAHSAQRMKLLTEIMPHIVQLDHFACN